MKLHSGKTFVCPHPGCVYRSRSHAELGYHARTHTGERPHRCEACDYAAKTKAQLVRHSKIHAGERAHRCPHCPFAARLSTHLKRHLRLHTGAKPFRCPHCPYTCNIIENLRKHVLLTSKHRGKMLYECKFCGGGEGAVGASEGAGSTPFATNAARDFRAHLVTAHPDRFRHASLAASYVAGIYDARDDPADVTTPVQPSPRWKRGKRVSATVTSGARAGKEHREGAEGDAHPSLEDLEAEATEAAAAAVMEAPPGQEEVVEEELDPSLLPMVLVPDGQEIVYIQMPVGEDAVDEGEEEAVGEDPAEVPVARPPVRVLFRRSGAQGGAPTFVSVLPSERSGHAAPLPALEHTTQSQQPQPPPNGDASGHPSAAGGPPYLLIL